MKNTSKLAEILRKLSTLFENLDIEQIASNTVWNIVLGVLPVKYEGRENEIMEFNLKDSTHEKIDNIDQITDLAEYFLKEKPDYGFSNLESFSYALRQLIRYTFEDELAEASLDRLKDLYLTFITSYYLQATKAGINKVASENIKFFCEKILNEDKNLLSKLSELY